MARIIYGVAGEGYGHASRAHVVGTRLIEAGHDVMFAGSNKSLKYLRQYFGDRVEEVFGLSFHFRDGRVDRVKTVVDNITKFAKSDHLNRKLFKNEFEPFRPDLVITDFEPFSAWWARWKKVPFISIDNIHAMTHLKIDHVPASLVSRMTGLAVTRAYYFGAFKYIVPSFFNAEPKTRAAVVAPPIVRLQAFEQKVTSDNNILIYATNPAHESLILEIAAQFKQHRFIIYGFNKSEQKNNCTFKEPSTEGFLSDLASCRGAIASAGFSLISECMALRKKMLVIPVPGQYEQIINAYYIEKLGLGISADDLAADALKRFIEKIPEPIPTDGRILWPDNEAFFKILAKVLNELPHPITI